MWASADKGAGSVQPVAGSFGVFATADWAARGVRVPCGTHPFYRPKESGDAELSLGLFDPVSPMRFIAETSSYRASKRYASAGDRPRLTEAANIALFGARAVRFARMRRHADLAAERPVVSLWTRLRLLALAVTLPLSLSACAQAPQESAPDVASLPDECTLLATIMLRDKAVEHVAACGPHPEDRTVFGFRDGRPAVITFYRAGVLEAAVERKPRENVSGKLTWIDRIEDLDANALDWRRPGFRLTTSGTFSSTGLPPLAFRETISRMGEQMLAGRNVIALRVVLDMSGEGLKSTFETKRYMDPEIGASIGASFEILGRRREVQTVAVALPGDPGFGAMLAQPLPSRGGAPSP